MHKQSFLHNLKESFIEFHQTLYTHLQDKYL